MSAAGRLRARFSSALACAFVSTVLILTTAPAYAGSAGGHDGVPRSFNLAACYQIVQREGRMIAWARWEERFPLAKTRQGEFAEDTPVWVTDLIKGWIEDAYTWTATDEQVQHWADELGDSSNLPTADDLSVPVTIAIWMRRLSRDCDAHEIQANAGGNEEIVADRALDARHL